MHLQFIGATGTVTGSKYKLTYENDQYLIDCGLFQGLKPLRLRNWAPFPFKADQIEAVVLTHAHLDHSGAIPLLVRAGFRGKIYCTPATRDLCAILLPDSGHIQEEDARLANKYNFSKHSPALPLYTRSEAEASLDFFKTIDFHEELKLNNGVKAHFIPAGHILGASLVKISTPSKSILFSGDLGRPNDIIMNPPETVNEADYLVIESTYGNRLHSDKNPKDELADIIHRTTSRGGTVVIPSFAVGRAQNILYLMHQLKEERKIRGIPVFVDSPMATDVTALYRKYSKSHRLTSAHCYQVCADATFVNTPDDSKALDVQSFPKVIISASGMATGGRVLHHIKAYGGDRRNSIVFAGYQAAGTRGEALLNGAKEVRIHGQYVEILAEVVQLDNLSAHADYREILSWLGNFSEPPQRTFITHGDPSQADALRHHIENRLQWACHVPEYLETVSL
jgi:metallo-beta-lactamase family protein